MAAADPVADAFAEGADVFEDPYVMQSFDDLSDVNNEMLFNEASSTQPIKTAQIRHNGSVQNEQNVEIIQVDDRQKIVNNVPLSEVVNENLIPANNEIIIQPVQPSFGTVTENLQSFDSIFSLGGKEYFLNNSGSKRLVIGVTCDTIPHLKIVFKIHDMKNEYHIEFSKKSWDAIVRHADTITSWLMGDVSSHMGEAFLNNEIISQKTCYRHENCLTISSCINGTSVTMMFPTFDRMLSLKDEVQNAYRELSKKIHDVTKRIKLFMDVTMFQLLKSNNIDHRHNYNYLMLLMNKNSNFIQLNNSIANTWEQLGKYITNEDQPSTSTNQT